MATQANLTFNVAALDNASKAFIRMAQQVEKLSDKLEELDRKRVQPSLDVDTAGVDRKVDRLSRDLNQLDRKRVQPKIDVDTLASGFSGAIIKFTAFGEALGKLALPPTLLASAGALGPALAAVASAAAQASGTLLLLPAAGVAGATAFSALAIGASGVGDALKALSAADENAAGASLARANAMRAVESATRNLEQATVHGAERIADAERAVARAQDDATQAQEDLNRAREDAVQRLRDMHLELEDAALSEQEATLSVEEARQRLDEAGRSGDPLDITHAQLGLERAELTLKQVTQRYQDLQKTAATASRAGVEGDAQVLQAHRRLEDATTDVADAQRDLGRTQRDVAEAQLDALNQLVAAQQALGAGGGVDKLAQSLAGLSVNAREFVLALQSAKPAFDDMRLDVQDALFAGLGQKVQDLAEVYLPILGRAFEPIAASANRTLTQIGDLLLARSGDFDHLGQTSAGIFDDLAQAVTPLVEALTDVAVVGGDVLRELTDGAGSAAQAFADFIREARESGQLEQWIRSGLDVLRQLGDVLVDVGGILSGVFRAASSDAENAIGPFGSLLDAVNKWVNSFEGQTALHTFFESGTRVVKAFLPVLERVADIIGTVVAPAIADLVEAAAPGLQEFVEGLGEGLEALAAPGADGATALNKVGQAISDVMKELGPALPIIGRELSKALIELAPQLDDLAVAFANLVIELAPYLPQLAELAVDLLPVLTPAIVLFAETLHDLLTPVSFLIDGIGFLSEEFGGLIGWLERITNPVIMLTEKFEDLRATSGEVGVEMVNSVRWTVESVENLWNGLLNWISGISSRVWGLAGNLWDGIVWAFRGALNTIIDLWNRIDFRISLSVPDWVPAIGGSSWTSGDIFPDIPYLDVGGIIERTGIAMVHKGEAVLPARTTALAAQGARNELLIRSDGSSAADAFIRMLQPAIRSRGGWQVVFDR